MSVTELQNSLDKNISQRDSLVFNLYWCHTLTLYKLYNEHPILYPTYFHVVVSAFIESRAKDQTLGLTLKNAKRVKELKVGDS